MTKDEIYQEFVSVTHFDASKVPGFNYNKHVDRINKVKLNGVEIISDCEGIAIDIPHSDEYITYFYKEETHVDQT